MRTIIIILSLISTCCFGYIALASQTLLSISAFIASLITLLTAIVNRKNNNRTQNSINQTVGNSSNVMQAGRDINYKSKIGGKK